LPTSAARVEFKTFYESTPVDGSEICFLPRSYDLNQVAGLLATREMRCLSGDKILELPRGDWYFYARNSLGLVGIHRSEVRHLASSDIRDSFKALRLDLVPAAKWSARDLKLGPDDILFAWGVESEKYQSPVFMLEPGADQLMVPANVPMIPIISHRGVPVWIGPPVITAKGSVRRLIRSEPATDRMNVIAWIAYATANERAIPPSLPEPVLEIQQKTYAPATDVGPVRFGNFVLLEFVGAPRKAGTFHLLNRGWDSSPISFAPSAGGRSLSTIRSSSSESSPAPQASDRDLFRSFDISGSVPPFKFHNR